MTAPFFALAFVQIVVAALATVLGTWSIYLGLAVGILLTGMLGIILDWLVIRRFRAAPAMMALVATVALGSVLRELIRALYPQGSNPKSFPSLASGSIELGGVTIPNFSVLVIFISVAMVAALFWMMSHSAIGIRIRAVAEDRDIARLMAISPDRIFAVTFFLASAVGAIGAIFFASHAGVVRFDFGVQLGLIGFSAAVIGGLGSMQGAILGSLLIAGIDSIVQITVPDGASYRLVFIFALVILTLVLKPSGILGKPVFEKV